MRRIRITLLLLVLGLVGRSPMLACDLSSLCLDSVTPAPGGTFYIYATLCVGAGITGIQAGADGNTGRLLFSLSSNTPGFAVINFTTPLVSQYTNIPYNGVNVGAQPAFYAAQAIFYNNSSNWFACRTTTIACGNVHQECVGVRFQVTSLPDSIRVYGVEGGDNLIGVGCAGPDMMISFNPNMDNCCVLSGSSSATPVTLCSTPNGTAAFTPNTGVAPYTFVWSNGGTTSSITGLSPGLYSLTVSDAIGCVQQLTVTVPDNTALPTSSQVSVTPATCLQANGSITIAAAGGSGAPYSYIWGTGSTSATLSNVTPGNYTVTVTDGSGCSQVDTFTIPNLPGPTLTVTNTTVDNCNMSTGSINLSVSGGTAPYSYQWSNGFTGQNPSSLNAGTYAVTITDSAGCVDVVGNINVQAYSGPVATYSTSQPSCGANGAIITTVNSGQSPFSFIWNTGATTQSLNNVGNGTYSVTITDGVGCQVIFSNIQLQGNPPVVANYSIVQPRCGNANGSIQTNITSGQSPFNYVWSNGSTTSSLQNVGNGTYFVTITDGNGCQTILTNIQLQGTPGPSVSVSSTVNDYCGLGIGGLQTAISGGTAPYTYLWSNGQTGSNAINLAGGQYTLTVTDAEGCTTSLTATVNSTAGPSVTTSVTPASGATNPDGSATAIASGGFPPYSYQWSSGSTGPIATGLLPGTYTVTITDSYGCVVTDTVVVGFVVGIDPGFEGQFTLFPNPADEQFTLRRTGDLDACEVILYDLQGKYLGMREWPVGSEELNWNVRNYAAGVYMLQLRSEKGIANFRVQKSN